MRHPGPPLPLVDTESFQPPEQVVCEGRGAPVAVVADEHSDAPGLAVVAHLELRALGAAGRLTQDAGDRLELAPRPGAEEGQRDVEVARGDSSPAELAQLPGGEGLDDVFGQAQSTEEAKPCIRIDGSGRGVACVCQFCVNRRRTRWSAAAAARERTASRSEG